MHDNATTPRILNSGDLVVIEEGWQLVAGEVCEARLVKRLFYPRSRSWDCFEAIVPRGGQTVVVEVNPWTRRAKLLEVKPVAGAKKGA